MHSLFATDKASLTILGLNSGTSSDGLDMAVVRVPRKGIAPIRFIAGSSLRYPFVIRQAILDLADSKTTSLDRVISVDSLLGRFFGKAAKRYIEKLRSQGIQIDAVASHGQTVRHLPHPQKLAGVNVHGTLQLGSLAEIAALTGKITVGDFRQADVALGNEGAPITVAAVARLFGSAKHSRLIVNIGGMANFFYIPAGRKLTLIEAADCGPGNVLSDLLCQRFFSEKYDKHGRHARKGRVSVRLVSQVMRMGFFDGSSKSTGRELFGRALAEQLIRQGKKLELSPEDLLATVVEITARGIARKVQPILARDGRISKLYLTGGGAYSSFLRERISVVLEAVQIDSVLSIGMEPSLTESASYAVMGAACLWSQPLPTRFERTAQQDVPILGLIAQPPVQVVARRTNKQG